MGIIERKEREKEQRQSDLIDAAERVFFSKGFALSTMDDVAEEAEFSKGTLYLYFKNKEDLYFAITARGLKILATMFQEARNQQNTGLDQVMAMGRAYVQFSKQHRNYFEALAYYDLKKINAEDMSSFSQSCHNLGQETLTLLIEAISFGISDQTINQDTDPQKTAIMLWGATTGLIQLLYTKGEHMQWNHDLDIKDLISNYFFEFMKRSLKG